MVDCNIPQEATHYIQAHQLLSKWNDQLEYLGYILSEIVDPGGLDKRGFVWHQAADIPAIEDTLRHASKTLHGRLQAVLSKEELEDFRNLICQSKKIRNALAHHEAPSEEIMRNLQRTKDKLSCKLQSVIGFVASKFDIDHVVWYADSRLCNGLHENQCREGMISLKGKPLLTQRQEIINSVLNQPIPHAPCHRRKATEESREKHREIFIAAQSRKIEKALHTMAIIENQTALNIERIDSQYYELRQQRLKQISHIVKLMQNEEKDWKLRRPSVTISGTQYEDNASFLLFLVLIAIVSPFWLCYIFARKIWTMTWNSFD